MTREPDTSIGKAARYGAATAIYYLCAAYVLEDWLWVNYLPNAGSRLGALLLWFGCLLVTHIMTFDGECE